MQDLSVYIHIPFCRQKCLYCDFLSAPGSEAEYEAYVQMLCREICAEAKRYKEHQVVTVFLGGGTPSLLSGKQIERILLSLGENYRLLPGAEITMEMNPGTVTKENLRNYRLAGINRISLGLQSADDRELKRLGRIHTWEDFLSSYALCRKMGIENVNVDLMSALPGQSLSSYMETLKKVTALQPEHISAYSLIIEEGTFFYQLYGEGQLPDGAEKRQEKNLPPLPDEDTERLMYEQGSAFLQSCGYQRYEISNYAKPKRKCAHNCVYWKRGDYAGFGVGAASMVDNVRWCNVSDMKQYLQLPADQKRMEVSRLSRKEQMEETMFLGLRMMQGVSKQEFFRCYEESMDAVYGEVLDKHARQGLLENGDCVRLTDKGIDVSNYVLADFLL